ncbi:precorrin-3B synthase [Nocardiopsis sediminis]|uniref:Precorrin-3B synthase n=1 Tax=Nocardiopsis sediminis TaxID=1778267 RepID=A0ABV8FK96_9ACTN
MPPSPGTPERGAPGAEAFRDRADACPGALRLHPAHDGGLARVRIPGGLLTVDQARVLAAAAEDLGDGNLDLTSRGNVQLRGLGEDAGRALAGLLEGAGLLPSRRHERVRNIVASPLSGLDGRGHADVRGIVGELDALLCASDAAPALSGRFLFAVDDGRGDTAALGADVTITALPGGAVGLRLGERTLSVPRDGAARWAVRAAEVFLDLARERGLGATAWRLADVDPDGGAVAARLGLPPAEPEAASPSDPSGAAIPSAASRTASQAAGPAAPSGPGGSTAPRPLLGLIDRPAGSARTALSVAVPLGRATAAQWRDLAAAAERGAGELRVTPWRGVVLPGLESGAAADVLAALAAVGLVTGDDSPWAGVSACTGRPGCAAALADVRADAAAVLDSHPVVPQPGRRPVHRSGCEPGVADPSVRPRPLVDGSGREPGVTDASDRPRLPVHWSGCERRCGHPSGRWVDAVAIGDGRYRITPRGGGPGEREAAHGGLGAAVAAARTTPPPRDM